MDSLATAVVAMLSALVPLLTGASASTIDPIINVLIELIPKIVQEIEDIGPSITNIIQALKSKGNVTSAQLAQLQIAEAQIDAAFEAAASAAGAPPPPSAS